jgi:hypothetical protein
VKWDVSVYVESGDGGVKEEENGFYLQIWVGELNLFGYFSWWIVGTWKHKKSSLEKTSILSLPPDLFSCSSSSMFLLKP